jgi:FkbM family methyltransferase
MLKRALEKTLSSVVVRRHLPPSFERAPFYASGSAGLKVLLQKSNDVHADLLRKADELVRRGDTVWDVGADVGVFMVAASIRAGSPGQVIAFEPDPNRFSLLTKTASTMSSRRRPVVVGEAVGRSTGKRHLKKSPRSRERNGVRAHARGSDIEVTTSSLDDLLTRYQKPHLIKIDVEGAEVEVLCGGVKMLCYVRPTILCDVSAEAEDGISELLRAANYKMFTGVKRKHEWTPIEKAAQTTVAIPREKITSYGIAV